MKVLVTGSTGFVGRHLCDYLEENTDWQILKAKRRDYINNNLLQYGGADIIINLASASSVEASVKDPVRFIEGNINSTLKVLELARVAKPKLFLHLSTVEVYNISNPYAASKASQEKIIEAYVKTYDLSAIVARSNNIIGEGQSPEKFVPKIVEQIKNKQVVTLYKTGSKTSSRTYVPVQNITDALKFLCDSWSSVSYGEMLEVDIDGGTTLTNFEMASMVANILEMKLHYEYAEPTEQRPTYASHLVANGKPLTSLGWTPPFLFSEGLKWVK